MNRYLLVMLGAALGGLSRYLVGTAVLQRFSTRYPENVFPVGTVVVNVTGCFLIGILMSVFVARADSNPNLRLLLVTGVLGGYTTFSSFAWESFEAVEKEQIWIGLANIVVSVVLGYLAVWCGAWVTRMLR
ncbi:MAG: fluoride efflux transporter CrcB [Acidobacteriota bacterium]|nr:fluoride efflux transporter CrcB [Acidobacteriota bacterium]